MYGLNSIGFISFFLVNNDCRDSRDSRQVLKKLHFTHCTAGLRSSRASHTSTVFSGFLIFSWLCSFLVLSLVMLLHVQVLSELRTSKLLLRKEKLNSEPQLQQHFIFIAVSLIIKPANLHQTLAPGAWEGCTRVSDHNLISSFSF